MTRVRIRAAAWPLIRDLKADPKELRGIAISLNKLEPAEGNALSPLKPGRGQSVLRFGSTSSAARAVFSNTSANECRRSRDLKLHGDTSEGDDDEASDDEQHDEPGVELPASLEKGPEASHAKTTWCFRPLQIGSRHSYCRRRLSMRLPPSTQLMLPSKSQIDRTSLMPFRPNTVDKSKPIRISF